MEDWWKRKIIRANKIRKRDRLERDLEAVNKEIVELDREIEEK